MSLSLTVRVFLLTGKSIEKLVEDIYSVIEGNGGWDKTLTDYLSGRLTKTIEGRLEAGSKPRGNYLRMSNLGTSCKRKLWYDINLEGGDVEPLRPPTRLKFMYGDILEDLLLVLAKAAGHSVEGEQDEMEIKGIKGHRDAVIDGVLIDVKSASSYSFEKFKSNNLREEDPFGYIEQLSSYLYASQDDPLVKDKRNAGFLVVDKVNGNICLDMYDLTKEMVGKEVYVDYIKDLVADEDVPPRDFDPIPHQKSGNMKLGTYCSYCAYKRECYPGLRTFVPGRGPLLFLTTVKREPKMREIKE